MANIVFLGSAGVGKGTYANIISKEYNIPTISSGDLLRTEVKSETELGKKAKAYMDKGELVPDELIDELIKNRISQPDCKNGFIFDGYPRNLDQAERLSKLAEINLVINLVTNEEVILDRLGGRIQCSKCGEIFHLRNIIPKVDGVCDKCGGKLYQRDDDQPEAIKKRLNIYHNSVKAVIEYYKKQGVLHDVDASYGYAEVNKIIDPIKKLIDNT